MAEHADATDPELTAHSKAEAPSEDNVAAESSGEVSTTRRPQSGIRPALIVGLLLVIALFGLAGWHGYRMYESHRAQQPRNLFVQVARQGALNLTTIDYTTIDTDVQRILDSLTGTFYDDFQQRSGAFSDVVKEAKSKTEGTITAAALESEHGDEGQVLVALSVKTSTAGVDEENPRSWRMRLGVQKVDEGAKVSNVEFVP
jgi:Mce-associated membrane protein